MFRRENGQTDDYDPGERTSYASVCINGDLTTYLSTYVLEAGRGKQRGKRDKLARRDETRRDESLWTRDR